MLCISSALSSGREQKVQGPIPSCTQMILPQLRQLGAAVRRGWRVARQSQRRDAGFVFPERDGLVWSSRVRMAESRSASAVEGACIEGPPERLTVVLGAGDAVLEDGWERVREWTLGRSEIRGPDAEEGGLGIEAVVVVGSCRASGLSERAKVFARGGSLCERREPAM